MTGDDRYKEIFKKKKGMRSMCDVAERLEKMGIEKGIIEGKLQVYENLLKKGFSKEEALKIVDLPKSGIK